MSAARFGRLAALVTVLLANRRQLMRAGSGVRRVRRGVARLGPTAFAVISYSSAMPNESNVGLFGDERGNSCCLRSSPILALAPT
jgi:hypothetical protein